MVNNLIHDTKIILCCLIKFPFLCISSFLWLLSPLLVYDVVGGYVVVVAVVVLVVEFVDPKHRGNFLIRNSSILLTHFMINFLGD